MTTNIDKRFECVKPEGELSQQCGRQCLWLCIDKGADKENPLPPRFMKCRFFKLKKGYGIFKM